VTLGLPHPNPARLGFSVPVDLAEAGAVRLSLVDPAGRLVLVLFEGNLEAGARLLSWSDSDKGGARLGSGVYLAVLDGGGTRISRRVMMLR
jgi:hypothetical protein